jgi:hypothetical protein
VLLISILCGGLTAYSQDSVKCFDLDQQRTILKKFDSLNTYKYLVELDKAYIDSLHVKYRNQLELSQRLNNELILSREKVARRNRFILIGLPSAFLVGLLIK